jgi:hypothetical protein
MDNGIVWNYEVISPTFFTRYRPSKTTETRMYYIMCGHQLGLLNF